jgi:hypothetical protein
LHSLSAQRRHSQLFEIVSPLKQGWGLPIQIEHECGACTTCHCSVAMCLPITFLWLICTLSCISPLRVGLSFPWRCIVTMHLSQQVLLFTVALDAFLMNCCLAVINSEVWHFIEQCYCSSSTLHCNVNSQRPSFASCAQLTSESRLWLAGIGQVGPQKPPSPRSSTEPKR